MFRIAPLLITAALWSAPATAQYAGEATGDGAELEFVMTLLAELNVQSIEENRELCGYLGLDRNGEYRTTRINTGQEASCTLPNWPVKLTVLASFHTHSTYSSEYDSEIPSVTDIESDEANGIDGYVATPGGRLWYIDTDEMIVSQICGLDCIPSDPNFIPDPEGTIHASYTYRAMLKRESYR